MSQIISIGSATLDIFLKGVGKEEILEKNSYFKELCFNLGRKNLVKEIFVQSGGGATNSATTFSRAQIKTTSVFCLGDDLFGKLILKELLSEGIDVSQVVIKKRTTSSLSLILVASDGSRVIFSYKIKAPLSFSFSKNLKPQWIYVSNLNGDQKSFKKIFDFSLRKKILLALNPGIFEIKFLKKKFSYLNQISVLILNQLEASKFSELPFYKEKEIIKKIRKVFSGIFIMTQGPKGALAITEKFLYQIPCFKAKKIVDRTGAGDAFGSGFISAIYLLEKKWPSLIRQKVYLKKPELLLEPLKFASANATSVVENFGSKTGILSYQKFKKMAHFKNLNIKISYLK